MFQAMIIFFLATGFIFLTGGTIGILRLPDFYTRLHAAGKLDTGGLLVLMIAMAVYAARDLTFIDLLTAAKIMLIVFFIFITSPTATHAIVDAGVRSGLKPWTQKQNGSPPETV